MVRAVLKSYRKNILREMKDNLSRMVSLFGIVALGVMMLTGLMSFVLEMPKNLCFHLLDVYQFSYIL